MQVNLDFDTSQLEGRVRNAPKRIAFAVVNTINRVVRLAQRAVQLHAGDVLTIRTKFAERQVAVIKPFASVRQGRAFAEIAVGQRPRLLLPFMEAGGPRPLLSPGSKSVAVPVAARPSQRESIPKSLYISRLGFRKPPDPAKPRKRKAPGPPQKVLVGALGSYLVPSIGIFQRLGETVTRLLYVFKRGLRLDPSLKFVATVRGVVDRNAKSIGEDEVRQALEFERGRR